MSFICPTCKENCKPTATNAVGVSVQEYNDLTGWVRINIPFETTCEARAALKALPDNGKPHRVYDVVKLQDGNYF